MSEFKPHEQNIADILEKLTSISLDAPFSNNNDDDPNNTLMDCLGEEATQQDAREESEMKEMVSQVLSKVSQREEQIIRMYFGINYESRFTLEEIAEQFGITKERVRQIKRKALRKLYCNLPKGQLEQFLLNR